MKRIIFLFICICTLIFGKEKTKLRAVSTAQFTTEILLSIGAEDQMIGTSFLDDKILPSLKKQYDKIPVLSERAPTKEQFYSINPNFLIGWKSIATEKNLGTPEELKENGVEVYFTKSQNSSKIDDIYIDILTLGKKFNVEKNAENVVKNMKNEIAKIKIKKSEKPVKVFAYDSQETAPFVVGGGGIGNTLIEMAGGENIFKNTSFSFGTGTWERVLDENPDYIVIVDYGKVNYKDKIKFLKENSPISEISAVKENKFIVVPLSYLSAGVRVPYAVKLMAEGFNK